MRSRVIPLALVVMSMPVGATQPGQALDCGDWVWLEPGYSCTTRSPEGGDTDSNLPGRGAGEIQVGADGRVLAIEKTWAPVGPCGSASLYRFRVVSFDGVSSQTVLGYVDERCVDPSISRRDALDFQDAAAGSPGGAALGRGKFNLDNVNGVLRIPLWSHCDSQSSGGVPYCAQVLVPPSNSAVWIAELRGLTPLLEIMQSYAPTQSSLTFRVPALPESLGGADHFDTYYGALTNPIDFTTAKPLACGFPASPPAAGDYITVADPLPTPAPGAGRYYLTAVGYEDQRRYGRQRIGGLLSGRNPALLPSCTE